MTGVTQDIANKRDQFDTPKTPKTPEDCLSHLNISTLERELAIAKINYIIQVEKGKTTEEDFNTFDHLINKTFGPRDVDASTPNQKPFVLYAKSKDTK